MINQILFFLMDHWVLSSLFLLLLIAVMVQEWINRSTGANTVSAEEMVQMINHQSAVVIDIRNSQTFLDGHILGSINILPDTSDRKWASLEKAKDKPIIIVCAMGQDAGKVAAGLNSQGYNALILKGGMQEWRSVGLPIVKK